MQSDRSKEHPGPGFRFVTQRLFRGAVSLRSPPTPQASTAVTGWLVRSAGGTRSLAELDPPSLAERMKAGSDRKVETDPNRCGNRDDVKPESVPHQRVRTYGIYTERDTSPFSDYTICIELSGSHVRRAGTMCAKDDHDGLKLFLSMVCLMPATSNRPLPHVSLADPLLHRRDE